MDSTPGLSLPAVAQVSDTGRREREEGSQVHQHWKLIFLPPQMINKVSNLAACSTKTSKADWHQPDVDQKESDTNADTRE
ncbi:hypothetical protein MUK42_35028 [Musa troglodytarum]|uniref:Uncharacterized protein n=1 Tax=Musa troglodytarum TaxID=320322 RepID=A0A9E7KGP8_9LILI|nr:hypothetical protein MUK42_35028 [Musa troglodytarum]URE17647.1 hypothetical protein MUK42_35028 [Musa troglodytarum]